MRLGRLAYVCLVTLSLGLAAVGSMAVEQYEQPTERQAAAVLPPEMVAGPHHRVQDPVVAYGYMDRLTVESPFGRFEVVGDSALRKLLNELRAIAALQEIKTSKAFADAVVAAALGPLQFAKHLITNPVDTLTGIPKGAYKFMEETTTGVTAKRDPSEDPTAMQLLEVSGQKRAFAFQLGVDVYSSNKVLQKELNSVAWAAAIGKLSVSAALLPVSGTAESVLSGVRWGQTLNEQLKDESATRLRIINQQQLLDMGIPPDLITRYLDHPAFTPRHDTIMVASLARLGSARGRGKFLEGALEADDEVDATFFTNVAQIMRGYHETVAPITALHMVGRLVVAQAGNEAALVPLPIDYCAWTRATERWIQELQAAYQAPGGNIHFEMWLTGTVSLLVRQQLSKRGITVTEEVYKRVEIID